MARLGMLPTNALFSVYGGGVIHEWSSRGKTQAFSTGEYLADVLSLGGILYSIGSAFTPWLK